MALVDKEFTFSVGATVIAAEHNTNFNTIYNDYNGNITDANIAAGALIQLSKLKLSDNATFTGTIAFTGSVTTRKVTRTANFGTHYTEGTAPSTAADEIVIYSKDSGTQPELFAREESDGTEVQLTSNGAVVFALGTITTITPAENTATQVTVDTMIYFSVSANGGSLAKVKVDVADDNGFSVNNFPFEQTGGGISAQINFTTLSIIVPATKWYRWVGSVSGGSETSRIISQTIGA